MIGVIAAALSQRFVFAGRGIPAGLVFCLCIDFCTEQNNEPRKKEPQHKNDDCSKAAIGFIKAAKVTH